MGMGEPLHNYRNVIRFLELATDENSLNLSMRNISLSTCGIVPAIYMLMENRFQLTLSVSLHASNNEIRSKIMPINNQYPLEQLLLACKEYSLKTSRRISFEYALFKDVNDTEKCAVQLSKILKGISCHLNLIPANSVEGSACSGSDMATIKRFKDILEEKNMTVTIRRTLGSDIDASCGQLRRRSIET
jgi:23S rRNA (adenine2503-C2)-methyltransferase